MGINDLFAQRRCPSPPAPPRPHPAVIEPLEPRLLLSGSIEGTVWHDLNADGIRDVGEAGLNGWTAELVNPLTHAVLATAVTASVDVNGNGQIDPMTESGLYALLAPADDTTYEVRLAWIPMGGEGLT